MCIQRFISALFAAIVIMPIFHACGGTSDTSGDTEIPVASISISQATAEMVIGETAQLRATITPSNATDKTIIWASSKQSVATIDQNGLVTAVSEGESTITVSAGGKNATCLVTVSSPIVPVSSIELDKNLVIMQVGTEVNLIATVLPSNATDNTVSWSSSDNAIATVDNGTVKGVSSGEAIITARAGEQSATCKVTVEKNADVISGDTYYTNESSVYQLVCSVYSSYASFYLDMSKLEDDLVAGKFANLNPSSSVIRNLWAKAYQVLSRANQVYDGLDSRDVFPEYKAHAQLIRGLIGYHLATLWGDVPYPRAPLSVDVIPSPKERQSILEDALEDIKNVHPDFEQPFSKQSVQKSHYINDDARRLMEAVALLTLGKKSDAKALLEPLASSDGLPEQIFVLFDTLQQSYAVYTKQIVTPLYKESNNEIEGLLSIWTENKLSYGYWEMLKRIGKAKEVSGCEDYQLLLPIPQTELDRNYNLKQNPGY